MAISMAILSGIVVSVMMVFNGQLSDLIDLYTATVLIHACGLLTMYIVLKVKHISLRDLPHASRFLYLGVCNRGIHCLLQQSDYYDFGSLND